MSPQKETHQMINRLFAAIAAMCLFAACGGEDFVYEEELATAEQPFVTVGGVDMGFQAQLASGQGDPACAYSGSLICAVPPDKTVTARATGTNMTAAQKQVVEDRIDLFTPRYVAEVSGWTFTRNPSGTVSDVNISYTSAVGGVAGTNKANINTYVKASMLNGTVLNDSGTQGQWAKYGRVDCLIDQKKIAQDFTVAQQPNVLAHALDYCLHKGWGIGSTTSATRSYGTAVNSSASKSADLGNRIKCLLNNYAVTAGNDIFPVCNDPGHFLTCACDGVAD